MLIAVAVILLLPLRGSAQEATLSGSVTDASGGVLPGVTVTALHEASGNTFVAVTDARGAFRLPLRTGNYNITVELAGFTTVNRRLELAVGQQVVANLQLSPSTIQETITVTGEAPLLDVRQSSVGGNVDVRQMQELPINGRNWLQLTMLAPGARTNAVQDAPTPREGTSSAYQLNVDGQQVSDVLSSSGSAQPRFSRDAIAEFEVITNRFDATQGRTSGIQVNAITKSGTNIFAGTVSGYFRDDRFKGEDFVARRVLPYSNQQVSATFGGPFKRDRAHFFAYYEHEREPLNLVFTSPWPKFNVDLTDTRTELKYGGRIDVQFSSSQRLMLKGSRWEHRFPFHLPRFQPGATLHPSGVAGGFHSADQYWVSHTKTFGSRAVNEIQGGYAPLHFDFDMYARFGQIGSPSGKAAQARVASAARAPGLLIPLDGDPPLILLRGYTLGTPNDYPQNIGQDMYQIRDNFSTVVNARGQHEIKLGGEYMYQMHHLFWDQLEHATLDATGGPVPENIEELIPDWTDWRTWNIAALSPVTRFYRKSFGSYIIYNPRDTFAAWFQDNWSITSRLTLNLGIRYDVSLGSIGDRVGELLPFRTRDRIKSDLGNVAPRLGFAYTLPDTKTIIRGGWGRYYAEPLDNPVHWTQMSIQTVVPTTLNDGRPNFAADPYNGQIPSRDGILASGARRDLAGNMILGNADDEYHTMYSNQASIGVQRQFGTTMAVEADYAWTGTRRDVFTRNLNLAYNPATRANYPFSDISRLPYPNFGLVPTYYSEGWSNYHGLQTAFTKRLSNSWQASATYTLAGFWDTTSAPKVGFEVAPDLGGDYTLAVTDQRHRAVFNGIWQLPYDFQLSGLYFYGSGARFGRSYGADLRGVGVSGENRLRPDGTIVPRNEFVGKPIHRVDLRIQRRFKLGAALPSTASPRCSTCSTTRTTGPTRRWKSPPPSEDRRRTTTWRTSRGWRSSGSASPSDVSEEREACR
jgi:hypothetical protein